MDRKKRKDSNIHVRQLECKKNAIKTDPEVHFLIHKGRIHLHQTSSARDAKGTALRKGEKKK